MENKTLKIGIIALSVIAATALIAGSAYAFSGRGKFNHGKFNFKNGQNSEARAQRHKMIGDNKIGALKTAIEKNDYSALGANPKITQEQFDKMVKNYQNKGKNGTNGMFRNRGMFNKTK